MYLHAHPYRKIFCGSLNLIGIRGDEAKSQSVLICRIVCATFCVLSAFASVAVSQREATTAAKIGDRVVTQQEVDDSIADQLRPLQEQIYALRKVALDNLITRTLLEDEAKKRGITVDELRKQLTSGSVAVSKDQLDQSYAENARAFGSMSPDEAKERVRLDLETQKRIELYRGALARLRADRHVEVFLAQPKLLVRTEDTAGAASLGENDAPVTIIEFSDFQCPFCRQSQATIKKVLESYGRQVRLIFKNFPLDIHPYAFSSAQAAVCAKEQGAFWKYHDALFTANDLSDSGLNKIAKALGLDSLKFDQCMTSEKSRQFVTEDITEGQRLGVNSTPTFIVNGSVIHGAVSFHDFSEVIDRELKSRSQ
ncbi:MAG TPA: thioredoxin domain-containing protein [Pyrinomonadaceae bacterium]|jgi:protein-disulfide isomerase|nr:thioredoxin domain-containing protein [Pyrinomonadaceae bacterium]